MEDAASLRSRFGGRIVETREFRGEWTVVATPEAVHEVLAECRKNLGYEMLLDISGVDHLGTEPRFDVVYELATVTNSKHLRVKIQQLFKLIFTEIDTFYWLRRPFKTSSSEFQLFIISSISSFIQKSLEDLNMLSKRILRKIKLMS